MSFDFDDFNYDYSHWHGDAGIPLSIFRGDASFPMEKEESSRYLREQELILKAAKVFAHLGTESAIFDALARELLKVGMPYAVKRYGKLERLPVENQELSQNENCLRYLAIHLFSEYTIALDTEVLKTIDRSLSDIKSTSTSVAYDKTGRFQEFLHREVVHQLGAGANLQIDQERMRTILSTARLHLSCEENRLGNLGEFRALSSLYASRISAEKQRNSKSRYGSDIRNWKLRHLKPMVWYFKEPTRAKLRMLVSEELTAEGRSLDSLKDQCAELLADAYNEAS